MKNLKKEIIEQGEIEKEKILKRIEDYKKEDKEANTNRMIYYHLQRYLTKRQFEKYNNKEISEVEAIQKAIEKEQKELEKRTQNKLNKLETIESAKDIESFKIIVEWKRSATWGMNPTATLQQWAETWSETTGHASGCGYDKESAAVAEALNQSNNILKALFEYKENKLQEGQSDKSKMSCNGIDNRDIIAYGAGYDVLPYFEGGVGMNCFINIFKLLGFECNETHTKATDIYIFTKMKQ